MIKFIKWAVLSLATALCCLIPWHTILARVYTWHMNQPEFYEGLGEVLVLLGLFALSSRFIAKKWLRLTVTLLGCAAYLTTHRVIAPFAANILLLDAYMGIGQRLLRAVRLQEKHGSAVAGTAHAVAGMAAAGCINILLCSIVPVTSSSTMIIGATLVLGAYLLNGFRSPLWTLLTRTHDLDRAESFVFSAILVLVLIQAAKAGVCLDYDSSWYGARPLNVLFSNAGFWHGLNLVHFVYYYPKLFEVLALPVSGTPFPAYIMCFNVAMLGLSTLPLYASLRKFYESRLQALLWVCAICCIPAYANMASTAKTDTASFFFGFAAVLFILEYSGTGIRHFAWLAISAVALLLSTKITAFAFALSLFLGLVIAHLLRPRNKPDTGITCPSLRPSQLQCLFALTVWSSFLIRTLIITGTPTFPLGTQQWHSLGITPLYPWNTFTSSLADLAPVSIKDFLLYLSDLLFNPSRYIHFVMSWPSNIAFLLGIICLLNPKAVVASIKSKGWHFLCLVPTCLMGLVLVAIVTKHSDGGTDGNYYTLPIVCTIICCLWVLNGTEKPSTSKWLPVAISVSLLPILFVSHWSWHQGTSRLQGRQWSLDPGIRFPDKDRLKAIGAGKICEYLQNRDHFSRSVGVSRNNPSEADEMVLRGLPGSYEELEQLEGSYRSIFDNEESFSTFLKQNKVSLFIAAKTSVEDNNRQTTALNHARNLLRQNAPMINDSGYYAFILD